jgi:hypothetical protein
MTVEAVIETSVGPVDVWHRLALAVECRDALTNQLVVTPLRVGYELPRSPYVPVPTPAYPCVLLDAAGPARFKLRHDVPLPARVQVRIDDPERRFVARRVRLRLWPSSRVDGGGARPYIPTDHRLLRIWVWPGTAGCLSPGSSVIRGRVMRGDKPARWARVTATGATNALAGFAHADDRGEFALVITDAGQQPLGATFPVDLTVESRRAPRAVDVDDPLADLTVEPIPRAPSPPAPAVLDSPRLRGLAPPPGYVANAKPATHVTVMTGADTTLPDDLEFGLTP